MRADFTSPYGNEFALVPVAALFAAAFIVLAWPWLSGSVTIPWDAKAQFYPQQVFLSRALAQGQSPFWTPNVFAGWPQISDPQSLIFSPAHLALSLATGAPSLRAFDAACFAMLLVGGLAILMLFRDRGWHPAGALAAALAFAFGASCAWRLQHTGQVVSVAWLALALWALSRALERGAWRAGAAAGLFAGLMALGRDQVALLGLYLLAGLVLTYWLAGAGRGARLRASIKPLAAATVVGFVVVAIPLAMTALLTAESNRPLTGLADAGRGSLHPAHLLTLLFADLFGAADPAVPYWGPPSFPWGPVDLFLAQNMGQLYFGALPLVALIGFGLARGALWMREIRFFAAAALLVLLYALGRYTPAFTVFYEILPGVALFRRPADATFLLGMLLAILGGYCVHRALTDEAMRARSEWLAIIAVLAVASATAGALALSTGALQQAAWPLAVGIGWIAAAGLTLAHAQRMAGKPLLAAALLLAFATADLAWNNAPNESTGLPPATYAALHPDTTDETVTLLKALLADPPTPQHRDRVELTGIAYHWPNLSLVHGFEHLFGQNPLRLADFARATGVGDTVAVPEQRTFAPLFPSYRSTMADLFGLRIVAAGAPIEQIDKTLAPGDLRSIGRTKDAFVYENPRALPRVMLVGESRKADFASLVRDGWPADVDPRTTVLLESEPQGASPQARVGGSVRLVRYGNGEVVVAVDAPSGAFVVLNDVWHPWWYAMVDGAPAEVLKANVLFRAVWVPPGRHEVRFVFRPFAGALREIAAKLGFSAR
jgi:hypothetical protein